MNTPSLRNDRKNRSNAQNGRQLKPTTNAHQNVTKSAPTSHRRKCSKIMWAVSRACGLRNPEDVLQNGIWQLHVSKDLADDAACCGEANWKRVVFPVRVTIEQATEDEVVQSEKAKRSSWYSVREFELENNIPFRPDIRLDPRYVIVKPQNGNRSNGTCRNGASN